MSKPSLAALQISRPIASLGAMLIACAAAAPAATAQSLPPGYSISDPIATASGRFVEASVQAMSAIPCAKTWEVFTDFQGLASFLPGIEASSVTSESQGGRKIIIHQAGTASIGMIRKRYSSDRELTLNPTESIHSKSLPSDEAQISSSTTFIPHGSSCEVSYGSNVETPAWAPSFMAASLAKKMAKQQMAAMLLEVARRNPAAATP